MLWQIATQFKRSLGPHSQARGQEGGTRRGARFQKLQNRTGSAKKRLRSWCPVRGNILHTHVFIQAKRTHENIHKYEEVRSGIFTNTFSTLAAAWGKEVSPLRVRTPEPTEVKRLAQDLAAQTRESCRQSGLPSQSPRTCHLSRRAVHHQEGAGSSQRQSTATRSRCRLYQWLSCNSLLAQVAECPSPALHSDLPSATSKGICHEGHVYRDHLCQLLLSKGTSQSH